MASWVEFGEPQKYRGFLITPCSECWTDGDHQCWYVVSDADGRRVHFDRDEPTSLRHAQKLIDQFADDV